MKKITILLILCIIAAYYSFGQNTIYRFLKPGSFKVGFTDTIIYHEKYRYEAFGYVGSKPFFLQIWYPLPKKIANQPHLPINYFFNSGSTDALHTVNQQLKLHFNEIVIRDCIADNLLTGLPNTFDGYSYSEILNLALQIKTNSLWQPLNDTLNYPVIIYHHGAQSNAFENFAMAEYFASKGYIFIAANFHLPYPNTIFGLKPFDKIIVNEDEESLKTVVAFAQSVSKNRNIFFIGHSLGAQMGFRTFAGDTCIKGFVSLETSIEFKSDDQKIDELWPEVFRKIKTENAYYPFPVLLCAATGKNEPFYFFRNLNAQSVVFVSTSDQFNHNAYTSIFFLRCFLNRNIIQTDLKILNNQLHLYVKHVELIADFFNKILNKKWHINNQTIYIKGK